MENFNLDNVNVRKLHTGDKVEGEVVLVTDNTIYLDIQCFTEGKMHLDHYTKDKSIESFKGIVKVGDKILAYAEAIKWINSFTTEEGVNNEDTN